MHLARLAIDAMGGDYAPQEVVKGALEALEQDEQIDLVLVGDEAQIVSCLQEGKTTKRMMERIHIQHAEEQIDTDEEPARAIRRKQNSSLVIACGMVKTGQTDAVVTAGNTGAFMAAGLLVVGRMEGVYRPALAPILPAMDNQSVLILDAGANMDAKAEHLVQYAMMGDAYARTVMGLPNPRIGLLNVGEEEAKGNELTKKTFPLLEQLPIHFVGNVEARQVPMGVCDVLVCEGFAGNTLIKTMEGTALFMLKMLKEAMTANVLSKMGALMLHKQLEKMKKKMDYSEHGGALMLGVHGLMIKCHGSSEARAFKQSILQAAQAVRGDLLGQIATGIELKRGEALS